EKPCFESTSRVVQLRDQVVSSRSEVTVIAAVFCSSLQVPSSDTDATPQPVIMISKILLVASLAAVSTVASPVYGPVSYGPALSYGYAAKAIQPLHTVAAAPVLHAPIVAAAPVLKHVEAYDPNPHYSFSYGVSDPHTGDSKHAEETLANGVVHGSYSLTEPDGTIRKVTYTADKIHGFNAVVEKSGHAVHAAPVLKKVVATPLVHAGLPYYHH
uniref:Uncharacterized protein n=2 Tax=Anopheles albimanus TaxID=7167 RepID=A0A182FQU1_ANOAL